MNLFKKVMSIFNFQNYLASQGVVSNDYMSSAISVWDELYKDSGRLSLASSIASETARLATLEMKSVISGSKRAEFLNDGYQEVLSDIRTICEIACAKGGIVLKPYVSNGTVYVSRVQAENFVPISFDETGRITDAAFVDRYVSGRKIYTRIERHTLKHGVYEIRNSSYVSSTNTDLGKQISLSETEMWKDLCPYVTCEGIKRPLFAYIKMPMANHLDITSPLGISVFAKIVPLIEDAEKQYERLLWEFESGERALYVDESAIRRDKHGNRALPDKRLYRLINSGNDALFEDWTPTLRGSEIAEGLNEILRRIEFGTGLAYGTLSDAQNIDRTAEEFRASKQRSYTHICEIQAAIKTGLIELAEAMDILADLYSLSESGKFYQSFEFDDSIVADRKTEFDEKMRLLEKGIIMPWELRMWYFGEEEAEAIKKLNEFGGKEL